MKTIKMEIPKWATWEKETYPTILDKVHELVKQLPKGCRFYPHLIHKELIKNRHFGHTKERRTREALLDLQDWGVIKHDKKDRTFFVNRNGNKVKLYEVV